MKNISSKIETKDLIYFLFVVFGVFALTFTILYIFGLVPKYFQGPEQIINTSEIESEYWVGNYDLNDSNLSDEFRPERISIDKIGVDTVVGQPETRDVAVLDKFLTRGAVHYPGSGTVKTGNIFIFGHSTGFRVVQNQAYKAFNDIGKLTKGDEIVLEVNNEKYIYNVTEVKLLDDDEALVSFDTSERLLTISTCNTFGEKQERWVVEAKFERTI